MEDVIINREGARNGNYAMFLDSQLETALKGRGCQLRAEVQGRCGEDERHQGQYGPETPQEPHGRGY